jgi:hypothetical protein
MNEDDRYRTQPLARWFTWAAIAAVVWMALGCLAYLLDVTTDHTSLPADQRAMAEAVPLWMKAAYAVAVWVGLAGAVLLLLRRRLAEPLLLVSLVASVVMFSAFFLVRDLRENMSSDQLLVPILVVLLGWTIYWFARHSRQRGWLR